MRNLEDKRLHHKVEQTTRALRILGMNVPPEVESATKAYLEAVNHPGSLVRVTCNQTVEQLVFNALAQIDDPRSEID